MTKIQRFFSNITFFAMVLLSHLALADGIFNSSKNNFLPVDDAFSIAGIEYINTNEINVSFKIAENYYLYKSKFEIISTPKAEVTLELPLGKTKEDEYFGKQEVFYKNVLVKLKTKQPLLNYDLKIKFQGCSELGLCYPPTVRKLNLNDKTKIQSRTLDSQISHDSNSLNYDKFIASVLSLFLAGLLLSLTPCVLPMVPVLSAVILGSNQSRAKLLTITYIFGVTSTYTLLGIIAGLTGNLLSSSLQNTFFIYMTSFLFFIFALAMFNVFQIRLPSAMTNMFNNLSNKFNSKNLLSTFMLGFLSALILSPCVAPPLAASILYIGQTGNYIFGGLSLFSLSLGMSVPLILVGFSLGQFLPKPGSWMDLIKQLMGFILIGMAIYILRPILNESLFFALQAINSIGALLFVIRQKKHFTNKTKGGLKTILILLLGVSLLFSYLSFKSDQNKNHYNRLTQFHQVQTINDLDRHIEQAKGQIIMIDYYADWCVACLEYEKYTFANPEVMTLMQSFYLIQIDVTENNKEHQKLLNRYSLFGPPGIIFYNQNGEHLKSLDIVGFKNAKDFKELITEIKNDI